MLVFLILLLGSVWSGLEDEVYPIAIYPQSDWLIPSVYEGSWSQCQCEICGKTIWRWDGGGNKWGGGMMSSPISCWNKPKVCILGFNKTLEVCNDCWGRYADGLEVEMSGLWENWLTRALNENKKNREQFEQERKATRKLELEADIKNLEIKIKELEK